MASIGFVLYFYINRRDRGDRRENPVVDFSARNRSHQSESLQLNNLCAFCVLGGNPSELALIGFVSLGPPIETSCRNHLAKRALRSNGRSANWLRFFNSVCFGFPTSCFGFPAQGRIVGFVLWQGSRSVLCENVPYPFNSVV